MKTTRRHLGAPLALLVIALAAGACVGPPDSVASGDMGTLSASLQLSPTTSLNTASYAISGPGSFSKAGSIDVSQSQTISATIGGIPAGNGFNLTISGTATDGLTVCTGSAMFSITPKMTTVVVIKIQCREPPKTGNVTITGTVNVCPIIDAVGASPGEVMVGGSIAVSGAAHDSDGRPAALTYAWTASSGMLAAASTPNPTLVCTAAGVSTLTLTVSDGDCADTGTVTVVCSPGAQPTPPPAIVKINEIESNGGTPGDWVELINIGGSPADLGSMLFGDNSTARYTIPAGTTLAPGAYFVLNELVSGAGNFNFGLGGGDSARLFQADGTTIVDSYTWTAHAAAGLSRCPAGIGDFVDRPTTKGAANDCPGGMAGTTGTGGTTGGGGTTGTGGSTATGTGGMGGLAALAWPTTDAVATVDETNQFPSNLSGLFYQPAAGTEPALLWAVQNSPSLLHRLVWNGVSWVGTATDGWAAGKTLRYTTGMGGPDSEGVTKAEMESSAIYVATERNNDASGVSRLSVLRFDTAATGGELTATHDWNLTADLPVVGSNLGLEGITWIPDTHLLANRFVDESTGMPYDPTRYAGHGTGLFFVGVEANGNIYGYALDHLAGGFQRVATLSSGQAGVMDLVFDRDVGQLWAYCDNTCGNKSSILRLDGGRLLLKSLIDRPATLPDSNNEGLALAPESECASGSKSVFWTDDSNFGGHAVRRGTVRCGLL